MSEIFGFDRVQCHDHERVRSVARMRRSRNPGTSCPDCASLHPGYESLRLQGRESRWNGSRARRRWWSAPVRSARLGQRQGDRGDLRARGRAGVLRGPQWRRRRGNRRKSSLSEGGKASPSPPMSPGPATSRRWSRRASRPMAASTCSTTMSASPRWAAWSR